MAGQAEQARQDQILKLAENYCACLWDFSSPFSPGQTLRGWLHLGGAAGSEKGGQALGSRMAPPEQPLRQLPVKAVCHQAPLPSLLETDLPR